MDITTFFQQCINGLSLGSMYALIAIGYTMVYGCLRLINFAHADIMMVGAFLSFFGMHSFGLPFFVSAIFAILLCGVLVFWLIKSLMCLCGMPLESLC